MNFDPRQYVRDVESAIDRIRTRIKNTARDDSRFQNFSPKVALTLGSGLSQLAEKIETPLIILYKNIPGFPESTAPGHKGELVLGFVEGIPIVGLSGRKHFYEVAQMPYGMMKVVFAVHVMAGLGIKTYISTNAVGGLRPGLRKGDLMIIKDHLEYGNMPNPLSGPHLNFGDNDYFQALNTAYDPELRRLFWNASMDIDPNRPIHEGTYTALSGRTYETAATCRVLRQLGVDIVGMSTVPEIITATNRGMKTLAVSLITNVVSEDGINTTSEGEVLGITSDTEIGDRLSKVFLAFLRSGHQKGFF